jgi:hypothetical protein
MHRTFSTFAAIAFALGSITTTACSDDTPAGPSQPDANQGGTATLKASAPTPVSPVGDVTISGLRPTMQVTSASGRFVNEEFAHDFELQTTSGSVVRNETMSGTAWSFPENLAVDTQYRWRARAVLNGIFGPWSDFQTFRTLNLPGCENGRLTDPKTYFFFVIGRTQGSPARDWEDVMRRSGIPAGPVAGQRFGSNAPFYGLSQQISSSGQLRGRVFLPTDTPNPFGYYIQDVDFLSDPSGSRWDWRPFGSPAYEPRACP